MSSICAFDISHYEQETATSFHDAYAAGYVLAILKATQGVSYTDPAFAGFRDRLKTIDGQLLGAYHFGTGENVCQQAEHFLNVAGDIPLLALDWESNSGAGGTMSVWQAETFVSTIYAEKNRWPLLYGGSLIKGSSIAANSPLHNCEIWLAQYADTPVLPNGWNEWRLWQFTGDGLGPKPHDVPGVGVNVDVNRFPGTPDDLRRWYGTL